MISNDQCQMFVAGIDDSTPTLPAEAVAVLIDSSNLRHLTSFCHDDADGIMADMVRARFSEAGLLEALGLVYQAPTPTRAAGFPLDWTAYQVGLFDNGDQRDRRGRALATRTQYAFDIKVWAGPDPNFRERAHWQATCNFWTRSFALKHVAKLAKRGSISPEFLEACVAFLEEADDQWRFGIPLQRTVGSGSRYDDEHFCAIELAGARPDRAMVCAHRTAFQIEEFAQSDPSGKPLTKAIGAARISRSPLPFWETQCLET